MRYRLQGSAHRITASGDFHPALKQNSLHVTILPSKYLCKEDVPPFALSPSLALVSQTLWPGQLSGRPLFSWALCHTRVLADNVGVVTTGAAASQ